ncbi:MAG TPA: NAD(+)/NADH kinase [Bacteroidales bacterium]|nr:NAD(+)/NADH kinase [Bacteroidales bacterium]HPJ60410.1 NAD(+)/NADH kinase [Bacteroidales bacterium]HPR12730.1 NAD(+)/NADH kinase [Bacteroidales bacterium]HRW85600.1 NAD(+)/NADH kinase [Bacteroidales bacterium]
MLQRVAIFSKDNNERTRNGVQSLVTELCSRGIHVQLHQSSEEPLSPCENDNIERFSDFRTLSDMPELVFSVGGDGTFLETVLKVKDLGIPVAGVNTGRMGFLANIPGEEIDKSVDQLCRNDYEIVERSMLEILKPEYLFEGEHGVALNEITIQKANLSMITIHVYVNEVFLNTYWADGLVISTATGSTAYNLSVGGPILSPSDESIIISPISPHNLTIRPIVLSGGSRLRMVMEGRTQECLITCDFRFRKLSIDQEIRISGWGRKMKTVMLNGRDFYSTLRNRLMWGADKRN